MIRYLQQQADNLGLPVTDLVLQLKHQAPLKEPESSQLIPEARAPSDIPEGHWLQPIEFQRPKTELEFVVRDPRSSNKQKMVRIHTGQDATGTTRVWEAIGQAAVCLPKHVIKDLQSYVPLHPISKARLMVLRGENIGLFVCRVMPSSLGDKTLTVRGVRRGKKGERDTAITEPFVVNVSDCCNTWESNDEKALHSDMQYIIS